MNDTHNRKLTGLSQKLRREMTKEERHLWYDFLKDQPQSFKRQKVIGRYIVDFYCAGAKLVIELDGSQHCEEEGRAADAERDKYLMSKGLTVRRYSNLDVMRNFEGVCTDILLYLNTSSASLRSAPSPQGEGTVPTKLQKSLPLEMKASDLASGTQICLQA